MTLLSRLAFLWLTRLWYHFCHTQFCKQNQVLITCVPKIIYSTHGRKVFTDNQMSLIKYIYYINNVSKDQDDSLVKQNSGRLHNSTGTGTGTTHNLELLVEEFQSIFTF
jgi:hypothetical protein